MGEDAAFSEVYSGLAPPLLAYLRRRTSSADRAEDLVQQTFLQMHRGRASFLPGAKVTPWAYAIARRLKGRSIADAAQALGCTCTAVKLRVHRASEVLRAVFAVAYAKRTS